jgi:3-deoxy-manno-octulosonate cytidylyltransferase (CMP-KDO synthetase)
MKLKNSNVIGIIPARYNSTRLEGKPLIDINGKPMIQHVYERASNVLSQLVVATDDIRISNCVKSFGGNCIMTSKEHKTGTNRCLEAFKKWSNIKNNNASVIINIQGDEPLLDTTHLNDIISCFNDPNTSIATLALKVKENTLLKEGSVYLTKDLNNFALYFSRFPIPFLRDIPKDKWTNHHNYYQHIGIYGFTKESLENFSNTKNSTLENAEKLEQLRWLEKGEKIKIATTDFFSQPVDTKEDLKIVRDYFNKKEN